MTDFLAFYPGRINWTALNIFDPLALTTPSISHKRAGWIRKVNFCIFSFLFSKCEIITTTKSGVFLKWIFGLKHKHFLYINFVSLTTHLDLLPVGKQVFVEHTLFAGFFCWSLVQAFTSPDGPSMVILWAFKILHIFKYVYIFILLTWQNDFKV